MFINSEDRFNLHDRNDKKTEDDMEFFVQLFGVPEERETGVYPNLWAIIDPNSLFLIAILQILGKELSLLKMRRATPSSCTEMESWTQTSLFPLIFSRQPRSRSPRGTKANHLSRNKMCFCLRPSINPSSFEWKSTKTLYVQKLDPPKIIYD